MDDCSLMVYAWPNTMDWVLGTGLGGFFLVATLMGIAACVSAALNPSNSPGERIMLLGCAVLCLLFGGALTAICVYIMFHDCAMIVG